MILFPPCKINLGLRIIRKRPDGYHDLETLFYPVPLKDALEMLPSGETTLQVTGADIPGDPSTNLCIKAHELLAADHPSVKPVNIYLHKRIPMGAGLGGGSSDGAAALLLLNRLFRLGLSREDLLPYATRLGSDCPFFLYDGPCFASGRGEILQPVELDMSDYRLVLVNPGIHVPTAWAFAQLTPQGKPAGATTPVPVTAWKDTLFNDLEPAVFAAHPVIREIKEQLYAAGAVYAAMSGSGSTVFGWFSKDKPVRLSLPEEYWVFHS
jgi:4-diphosphocytidyl-2-C-methyl-D-erythritol kinase